MSVESNKTLGGIGALLVGIGFLVPFLSLVGIILVFIALKGMADYYNDSGIFQNALYGLIFLIVGVIVGALVILGAFFGIGVWTEMAPDYTDIGALGAFIGTLIIGVVILFVFYLLAAIFFKKSFDSLKTKTGENMFGTAGMLMLVGAILTIVVIGLILMLIAWILAAVAFFSVKTGAPPPGPAPPPPPPS
jgi:uncharacterized membrane protein